MDIFNPAVQLTIVGDRIIALKVFYGWFKDFRLLFQLTINDTISINMSFWELAIK